MALSEQHFTSMPAESYTVVSNPVSIEHGDLNVLFSGESQTKPGHKLGPKVYDLYLLHHVLSGHGTFWQGDHAYPIGPGQSFLIRPESLVAYESDRAKPWRYRWIAFAGASSEEMLAAVGLSKAGGSPIIDTGASGKPAAYFRRMQRTFREGSPYAHIEAAGLLRLLFAEYGRALAVLQGEQPPRLGEESSALVQQVIRYLSTQYTEPVSIERMADTLGFNRAYLSRAFKRHTGMTPVNFLLKLRIDKARQLLRERKELTTQQIAASVGFQDPLYFSKQFRRFYGQPPSVYREEMRRV
jgi:AraC-like DNA-binding protein